jgi:hypothetical protein
MTGKQNEASDQALLDLCARAAELEAKVDQAYRLDPEDEVAISELEEELSPIHERILAIRPATLKGLVAKARRASWVRSDHDPGVRAMATYLNEKFDTSIIADLLAMET